MALTDKMQNCNVKPITVRSENEHTIPAQATPNIYASISVSNDHPITGTVQPLPQFDENAKLIVAPAITTARDKRVAIKIANTTGFFYTIMANTKLAELQILKPEATKSIRPVDITTLKLLTDHDDVVTYVNVRQPDNPGTESEHTLIQQKILQKLRELEVLEKLNPKKSEESRNKFLSMFNWDDSLISGENRANRESIIVEFNDIFARDRLNIGMKNSRSA